jgi:uncharacterized membrane protein
MALDQLLSILLRWLHISSVLVLLGGVIYARYVLHPALQALPADARRQTAELLAASFRPWILGAVAALLASGLYNLSTKPAVPAGYHMVFGLKMLLALHIFAVAFLLGKPGVEETKRARWMSGIAVSGLIAVALSAYLRWLSR